MAHHVGLATLLAEYMSDVCEAACAFLPQHAGADLAIHDLRCKRDARERLVFSQRACAQLSGELSQPERSVEAGRRVDEILRTCDGDLATRAHESLQLDEDGLEIDGMAAILPGPCGERGHARARIGGCR